MVDYRLPPEQLPAVGQRLGLGALLTLNPECCAGDCDLFSDTTKLCETSSGTLLPFFLSSVSCVCKTNELPVMPQK